jgi:hypothetical protein
MSRYDWGQRHPGIDRLEEQISEARVAVVAHPLYAALDSHQAIRTFLEHHVFAVWDFSSDMKSHTANTWRSGRSLSTTCSPCGTSCRC